VIQDILVLGAGSAGLLAALTVKHKLPELSVRVLRSPEIGVIGVGESTTPNLPYHLFQYLGLNTRRFYELARPTWKMGIHFLWGPRASFEYTFDPQLDVRVAELPRPNGYYCDDDFTNVNLQSALMSQNRVFARQPEGGGPHIPAAHALHLENVRFVAALEVFARECGIEIIDGKMESALRGPRGIAAIVLEDGRRMTADFFIDASGFRSELLGKALEEPFLSYSSSLFNDRAILASWQRDPDEPILPYTTAETMDAGWCWRIDHEDIVNRGYVHCSSAISEDDARVELARKNPRATILDRPVKFRSGRYQRGWVDNVMGVGNACGFVEPLESTAILVVCGQCENFVEMLKNVGPTPSMRDLWNLEWARTWDDLRDFLTIHFCTNTRLDTPYWQRCRADADTSRLTSLLEFYRDNGPTGYARYLLTNPGSLFGVEGYLAMFVGNRVPYRNRHSPTDDEWRLFNNRRAQFRAEAEQGMSVEEALTYVKHPDWRWNRD
jgi:tryptophan halogenase